MSKPVIKTVPTDIVNIMMMVGKMLGSVMLTSLLHLPGAVERRRLVEIGVDIGNRRHIDDGAVPCALPDTRKRIDPPEILGVGEHIFLRRAQRDEQVGNDARIAQKVFDERTDDDGRHEIGHITHRLGDALEGPEAHLREDEAEDDGSEEADGEVHRRHHAGIAEDERERLVGEEIVKNSSKPCIPAHSLPKTPRPGL